MGSKERSRACASFERRHAPRECSSAAFSQACHVISDVGFAGFPLPIRESPESPESPNGVCCGDKHIIISTHIYSSSGKTVFIAKFGDIWQYLYSVLCSASVFIFSAGDACMQREQHSLL